MYRVFRVFRDNEGKIFHKVPVGGAKTERGARALVARQWGECIIVKIWCVGIKRVWISAPRRGAFLLQDFICCNIIQYTIPKFENKISF